MKRWHCSGLRTDPVCIRAAMWHVTPDMLHGGKQTLRVCNQHLPHVIPPSGAIVRAVDHKPKLLNRQHQGKG